MPGTGLHPLRGQNNVQGASDAGLIPMYFPDYKSVEKLDIRGWYENFWGQTLDPKRGLTVVEIMDAVHEGEITGMYIMGENPAMSDPDQDHARAALVKLEHLVVQDIFLTETAWYADVVLPASAHAEKLGTFTNTNRQVQMGRPALDPPGDARQDWELIVELAQRVGLDWKYEHVSDVYTEMAAAMPSLKNISWERVDREDSVIYPARAPDVPGDKIAFTDGFPTADGRGKIVPADLLPPDEVPDAEYPLVLTTGRLLEHWHTGSMTRRAGVLDAIEPVGIAAMNPRDMQKRGLHQGEKITVETRRGLLEAILRSDREVAEGMIFMPFCFAESPANRLTNPKLDPFGKIPEFKYCAARVERAPQTRARERGGGHGLAVRLIGLAGWSGSGKTTLLVKLLPALIARGRSVSTLKHAHHAFDVDQPGKDSYHHRLAGAREVLISSARRWALMHELRAEAEPTIGRARAALVACRPRHRRRLKVGKPREARSAPRGAGQTAAVSERSAHRRDCERSTTGERAATVRRSRRHRGDRRSRRQARAAVSMSATADPWWASCLPAAAPFDSAARKPSRCSTDGRCLRGPPSACSTVCRSVAINVRLGTEAEAVAKALGYPTLYDEPGDALGPLAGVKVGLIWAEQQGAHALAVSPCDAPLLPDDLYVRLLERAERRRRDGRNPRRPSAALRSVAGRGAAGSSRSVGRWSSSADVATAGAARRAQGVVRASRGVREHQYARRIGRGRGSTRAHSETKSIAAHAAAAAPGHVVETRRC